MTEATFQVACGKCGEGISVTMEQVAEAKSLGVPLTVQHEVCPKDTRVEDPIYHFQIILTRQTKVDEDGDGNVVMKEEKIAQVGDQVQAPSFEAALPSLQKSINKQWESVTQMAQVADQD